MPGSVRIKNVNGISTVVDVNTVGGSPTRLAAFSDKALTQSVSLPATITADTTYWLPVTGGVTLSVKVGGTEIGPGEVFLSNDAPVTFALDTNANNSDVDQLLTKVSPGGSVPDSRISLLSFDAVSLAAPTAVTGLFVDASAGTDLTLDVDAMTVYVATAGLYYLQSSLQVVGDSTKAQIMPNPVWAGDGNMLSQQHNVDINKYVWITAMARLDVGSFVFDVGASGGAGNDSSNGFAADIYRLA